MGTKDREEESGKRMSKKWLLGLVATGIFAGAGKFVAFDNIIPTFVDPTNYGVRVRSGEIAKGDEHLKNGLYWTRLFYDKIYMLKENTIILDLDKTGAKNGQGNTQDQNLLQAKIRMHYNNDPKSGVIAFHVKEMASDDGKELLTSLIDQSFDAAAGSDKAVGTLNDPRKFLYTFADNLQWRLNQNNVAIKLDAFELLEFTVGDGRNPLRTPVMLRLKRANDGQWRVEDITGPAPVPAIAAAPQATTPKP